MTQVTPPSIAYIATQVSVAVYFNTLYHADGCVSHRSDFPCLHRLYFLEQIRSLIPRDFIIQFLTFSTTLTRNTRSTISLTGGTGTTFNFFNCYELTVEISFSQIFPSYSSARRPICQNSTLARIKAKRLEAQSASAINIES
jgi:hypothetical protein